jgi:nucleotide-binding universal stress UspA family protein
VAPRAAELQADFIAISPNRKRLAPTVQQLARACNRPILVPKVLRTGDAAEDILHQAQRFNADIIIIGARPHATARARETAARVMRRAQRSVLVAPLTVRAGGERLIPAS